MKKKDKNDFWSQGRRLEKIEKGKQNLTPTMEYLFLSISITDTLPVGRMETSRCENLWIDVIFAPNSIWDYEKFYHCGIPTLTWHFCNRKKTCKQCVST